jgi:hypothetical protein
MAERITSRRACAFARIAKGGEAMTLHGHVEKGVVVLDNGSRLPDGTLVQVTPLADEAGNPLAVIAAMEAEPHLSAEDVAELQRAIAAGKRSAAAIDPFA